MNPTSTDPNPIRTRLEKFTGYLQHDPQNFPLLCEVGDMCLELNDFIRARPSLDQALALRPTTSTPCWWPAPPRWL